MGCGKGAAEIQLAGMCRFESLPGLDLSPQSVLAANDAAAKAGHPEVTFAKANVLEYDLPSNAFDVVFAWSSLHHFKNIDRVLARLADTLKPDGFLVVNEFVGPDRFQWTPRQISEANRMLQTILVRYRTRGVRNR